MSRIRLLLLGLLAVLAVGAVSAVSSASAETCTGGSHWVVCTSPGNVPVVHELVLGLSKSGVSSVLAGLLGGVEAKFSCPDVHFHGTFELLGMVSGLLYFLNCKEEKPNTCKLSAADEVEIVAHFLGQLESATLALFTGTGAAEEFATLEVENAPGQTCPTTGLLPVTGKQMVELPGGAVGSENQEVVAKKSESFLKFASQTASFSSTAEVHLGGANAGSAWLVMSGE